MSGPATLVTPDYLRKANAEMLCRLIYDYWAKRGYDILLWIEPFNVGRSITHVEGGCWAVRSNMVNGVPQTKLAAVA